ncbi:MAG TPA: DUF58 domain-containing protein [Anaerolineae bacterium]|nr:DUF58 domain-containing protein [Anaerolineae bacterium]
MPAPPGSPEGGPVAQTQVSPRSALLIGVILTLLLLGLGTRSAGILVLILPPAIYLAAGLLFGPDTLRLETTRTIGRDYAAPDEPITVSVTVTNRGSRLEAVVLEDGVAPPATRIDGESRVLAALEPGKSIEIAYTLRAGRGCYRFRGVQATASDTLGVFQRGALAPAPGQFFVLPNVLRLRRVAIRPSRTRVYAGDVPARQGGPGIDFFGVREYQSGDPLHWINWKATARAWEAIFTNEFEQERIADVGLILDVRRRAYSGLNGHPIFEHAVLAAAALAEAFLKAGNRVGVLLYGTLLDWTFPGYGKRQRRRVLHALARAAPGDSMVFDRLEYIPTRLFPPQSQLVVISPLLEDDVEPLIALRAHNYSLMVISPDPIPVELEALGGRPSAALAARLARIERALVIRKLRQAGARVLDWNVGVPFEEAVYAAFGRAPPQARPVRTWL